jgi:hypothetical protein
MVEISLSGPGEGPRKETTGAYSTISVDGKPRELRLVGRPGESLDYWLGE